MPNYYQGIRKHRVAIGAYLAKQFYEGFPEISESQRKIVHLCYDQIWGNKKKIPVSKAKDIRIKKVAKNTWDDSSLTDMLSEAQKVLLQHEVEFKRKGNIDKYGERVGIMLDSQFSTDPQFAYAFTGLINSQTYKNMNFY